MKQQYRFLLIGVVALALVAGFTLTGGGQDGGPEGALSLQAPAFVRAAEGDGSAASAQVTAQLAAEAGISAYLQTSSPINLSLIEGEFRTIETRTDDYIIGSVPVPDHPEHFDVHVYVHKDGWILAYYMNNEPTAKIVDVRGWTISSTKLETVISIIAGTLGEPMTGLKYYDFRYPNATHILMVAEDHHDGREFYIEMPTEYGYSERSFAVYSSDSRGQNLYINGSAASRTWVGSNMAYGSIPASQLLPGQTHKVNLHSMGSTYGVLVITYREQ